MTFTEETSNPNDGGLSSCGSRSFEDVIAAGVPEVGDDDVAALIEHLRARPRTPPDDPNAWDPDGDSVLAHAARRDDRAEIERLLARGARPNEACRSGAFPLQHAAVGLALAAIEVLVSAGARVRDEMLTSAFWAKGPDDRRAACLTRFMAAGASPSRELVWRAAAFGWTTTLGVLLAGGGDASRATPTGGLAIVDGARSREVLALLIAAGADVRARDALGRSALEQAIVFGNSDAALLLIEHGALADLRPHELERARALAVDHQHAQVERAISDATR